MQKDCGRHRDGTPPRRVPFVASIGFPEEFAASQETRREPEEIISGPIELPRLHDFQEEVLEGIRALVTSGSRGDVPWSACRPAVARPA